MSYRFTAIDIKNQTYYFCNDIITKENSDSVDIKIDKKINKDILIYYIGYVIIKEYVKIYSVNPLYLICRCVNGYFEEINRNRYLTVVPTNKNKEKKLKTEEL